MRRSQKTVVESIFTTLDIQALFIRLISTKNKKIFKSIISALKIKNI